MPSTTLITGGAGFIGGAVADALIQAGDRVVLLDILHPQVHAGFGRPPRLASEAELLPVDVTNAANWDAVLRLVRPDKVIHLAAETGTGQSLNEATRHVKVNVLGTSQMVDAFIRHGMSPGQILLASSRAVYGEGLWRTESDETFVPPPRRHLDLENAQWDPVGPLGEKVSPIPHRADTTPAKPTSVYGATKMAQEMILSAWAVAKGVPLSVLRLQNVYGPGQSLTNSYTGIVSLFARVAKQGDPIDVYEDGNILRDFVFIEDVVDAIMAAIAQPPEAERVLDIGAGDATTIKGLADAIAAHYGAPAPVVSGRFRDGDVRAACADIAPAQSLLGYRPKWELSDGLGALFEWIDDEVTS
jgi:dTDP-L-rhamnose 4-epimerase